MNTILKVAKKSLVIALLPLSAFADQDSYGTLTVAGSPGSTQPDSYLIHSCALDSSGVPKKFGCTPLTPEAPLNRPVPLPEGDYLIRYSWQTSNLIRVTRGENVTVQLQSVPLPWKTGSERISVFVDLTDPSEQQKFLISEWADSTMEQWVEVICVEKQTPSQACIDWMKNDYRALGEHIRFNPDASLRISALMQNGRLPFSRVEIARVKEGESVSALPGVLGISVYDESTDVNTDHYGIKIQEQK